MPVEIRFVSFVEFVSNSGASPQDTRRHGKCSIGDRKFSMSLLSCCDLRSCVWSSQHEGLLTIHGDKRMMRRVIDHEPVPNLDGRTMFVSTTADTGVVSSETRLHFIQRGSRVAARYSGGRV